jgi:hypothetical protein
MEAMIAIAIPDFICCSCQIVGRRPFRNRTDRGFRAYDAAVNRRL